MKQDYLKIPHNCYLILTSNCNMRCKHCYGNYGMSVPNNELSGSEWIKVIEDLAKEGVFFVNISGGEPTVHLDFAEIIKSLIKNEIYFMLTTNGVFNDNIMKVILSAKDYILGVQVSLDGVDPKTHSFIRKDANGNSNSNLFDKALNTIKTLVDNEIRTSIASCIHKNNINKITELKELVIAIKPKNWSLSTISISGRAKDYENLFVSESELSKDYWLDLKAECNKNGITVGFVDMPSMVQENPNAKIYYECPAAKWFCEINSDGTVTPCPLARMNPPQKKIIWENIREKGIKEIWKGEAFNGFRYYQKNGCNGCAAKDKCDRCPPQSVQWFDDPLMPTPYCILNGEKLGLDNLDKLKERLEQAKIENKRETYGIKEVV